MVRRRLLRQPAAWAARCIALEYLDAARAAQARLKDKDADAGDEALHDFRVALRRTRSVWRAYRPWLGEASRKLRRRLRALTRDTNVARDIEVMMEWLRTERRRVRPPHRPGYAWLQARLAQRYADSRAEIIREVLKEFSGIETRLRAFLALRPGAETPSSDPGYAAVTAGLVREHAAELAAHLASIESEDDAGAIHAARIRGKRLRYLIEPLADELPVAMALAGRLKQFQDRFGMLCDAFVQRRELAEAVEAVGAAAARDRLTRALGGKGAEVPVNVLPGLLGLALRLRDETRRRYAVVQRHYLGKRADGFCEAFEPLARALDERT